MKRFYLLPAIAILLSFAACNMQMEWNEETEKEFTKQCLNKFADQFKAENKTEFCDCFVGKLKAEQMGMVEMMKQMKGIAEGCGGKFE